MAQPQPVRYPRAVTALRAVVYLFGASVAAVVLGSTAAFLAAAVVVGVLTALVAGSGTAALVVGTVGLLVAALSLALVVLGTRRADRWLVRTARAPDPLERAADRYVAGEVDEAGLERELERVLDAPGDGPGTADRAGDPPERVPLRE